MSALVRENVRCMTPGRWGGSTSGLSILRSDGVGGGVEPSYGCQLTDANSKWKLRPG